jgi:hypothetical protein
MATPTPSKHPPVAATPPVSTPFSQSHLTAGASAFSPHGQQQHGSSGPRSVVPSPSQFKKSPANSNTVYGHPTNSSFGAMNFDSPSTAAALGALGPGMGMGIGDLALDAAGALVLAPGSMSAGMGRGDEDEKRKRLQQVIDILKVNEGRVSEVGLERLGRRLGLDCLLENQMGSGGTIRTLVIAGTGLSLEVDFANNVAVKVSLSYPESPDIVTKHSNRAAEILLRDLQLGPEESPLTKMLDKFAVNLERLATLDKLSVMPTLNCHEAVAGIYESLKRLHEWEISRLKEEEDLKDKTAEYITRTALCSKSGRPLMNARQIVGLSLDYWRERHIRPKESMSKAITHEAPDEPKTWSLVVECAPSSALVYASVRVTDKWISSDIQKANPTTEDLIMETGGAILDWQEPENILLPSTEAKGDGAMEGIEQELSTSNSKYPDVMFVAKFQPPLMVPYSIASQIYSSTGATMDSYVPGPTLDSLLFPPKADEKSEPDATYRRLRRQQSVAVVEGGNQRTSKTHRNTLTFQKLEYGRTMTELPFSHPRQLVELLPIFRQYARINSLLDKSFGSHTTEVLPNEDESSPECTVRDEYEAFLAEALSDSAQPPQFDKLPVDITVYTQPHPTLRLTFPFRRRTADICFEIGMNGALTVAFENVLSDDDEDDFGGKSRGKGRQLVSADLGRILEISEDLGLFVEFVRMRLQ